MDAMTIPDVWSGQDRALTVEDMENMPDDEFRYELDDGVLIVSPAPSGPAPTRGDAPHRDTQRCLSRRAGHAARRRRQRQQVPTQGAGCGGSAHAAPLESFFQETPPSESPTSF